MAQSCNTRSIHTLSGKLSESSGLINVNGEFITFNDSGGKPELYVIDTVTGGVNRTVKLNNAKNEDWEAIAVDDSHIYIGDIGNNSGHRKALVVYKVSLEKFKNSNTIEVDSIVFSFQETENSKKSYDAEALVVINNSLYLFSKNWKSNYSYCYQIPKEQGIYSLTMKDSIKTPGRVTDAAYDKQSGILYLLGYAIEPFLVKISNFNNVEQRHSIACRINVVNSLQTEGICTVQGRVFITSENFKFGGIEYVGELTEVIDAEFISQVEIDDSRLTVVDKSDEILLKSTKGKMKYIQAFDKEGVSLYQKEIENKEFVLKKTKLESGVNSIQVTLKNNEVVRFKVKLVH